MTATVTSPPEQRIVLHDISWETYERLLADHVDSSAPRFTYDRGELEILSPSTEHEEDNRTLALLVEIIAIEWSLRFRSVGSMTFKRQRLQKGFEPDSSFYFQNEERVRGRRQIDLAVDPPPDLIIEIEITRSAILRLPLFASMSVPEIWRWDGERIVILHLTGDGYAEADQSLALPPLTSEVLTRLLVESRTLERAVWARRVRAWAQSAAAS
jgi:Uma2 family endonuclease